MALQLGSRDLILLVEFPYDQSAALYINVLNKYLPIIVLVS